MKVFTALSFGLLPGKEDWKCWVITFPNIDWANISYFLNIINFWFLVFPELDSCKVKNAYPYNISDALDKQKAIKLLKLNRMLTKYVILAKIFNETVGFLNCENYLVPCQSRTQLS